MPYYGENDSFVGEDNEELRESVADYTLSFVVILIAIVFIVGILFGIGLFARWIITSVLATVL